MTPTKENDAHLATADLAAAPAGRTQAGQEDGHLLPEGVTKDFRSRWDTVQAGFVDEPREAVRQADELVAQSIQQLASTFSQERNKLEGQWDKGGDVSTEDLRIALQKYRSFFHRLLSI